MKKHKLILVGSKLNTKCKNRIFGGTPPIKKGDIKPPKRR